MEDIVNVVAVIMMSNPTAVLVGLVAIGIVLAMRLPWQRSRK